MNKFIFCFAILFFQLSFSQKVGVGTTNPVASLHVRTLGNTSATKGFLVKNSDGEILAEQYDNGIFRVGISDITPDSQLTIFAQNNNSVGTMPAFQDITFNTFINKPQSFKIYMNPAAASFNPSAMGYWNWITDNDGEISTYQTTALPNHIYFGAFYGNNRGENSAAPNNFGTSMRASGFYLRESGPVVFSVYRDDYSLSSTGSAVYTSGSVKLADEGNNYIAGANCQNPGTIAFNSTTNSFLGCAENFDATGTTVLSITWKNLNNF